MAKCKMCGKKSLFLTLSNRGYCATCEAKAQNFEKKRQKDKEFLEKAKAENQRRHERLDAENKILAIYNKANQQYKKDQDIDTLITEYEKAFTQTELLPAHNGRIKLVKLYVKTNQNDKAWGYLNQAILYNSNNPTMMGSIRLEMFKILRKEEKFKDAVEMLMLGYMNYSWRYDNKWTSKYFDKEGFEKDIKTTAKKLGWDDDKIQQLEKIIVEIVDSTKRSKEGALIKEYRALYKSWE